MRILDPRSRVLAACAFALVVVALGQPASAGLALALAVAAAVPARLEFRQTLRRLIALDGFIILAVAMLPFTVPGEAWITVLGLDASREGATQALLIVLKANAVVLMVLALIGALEPVRLGHALGRLGLPDTLVQVMLFTLRYLDVLEHEYRRLRIAMRARAFRLGANIHTWRSVGYLFGMLLVRGIERSERVVAAMRCRGFDGVFRPLAPVERFGHADAVFAFATLAALAMVAGVEVLGCHPEPWRGISSLSTVQAATG